MGTPNYYTVITNVGGGGEQPRGDIANLPRLCHGRGDGRYWTDKINAKAIVKKGVEIFMGQKRRKIQIQDIILHGI